MNNIKGQALANLKESLLHCQLRILSLFYNPIEEEGAHYIAESLKLNPCLSSLGK
jgi:hypothetical protein